MSKILNASKALKNQQPSNFVGDYWLCLKILKKDGAMNELVFYGYAAPSKRDWDITKDGIWDVFDLIMMKQAVIRNEGYSVSDLVGLSRFIHGIDK